MPVVPAVPDVLFPDVPELLFNPDVPDEPLAVEGCDVPEFVFIPDVPDEPFDAFVEPETPVVPDEPVNPVVPVVPDVPELLATPDEPVVPRVPEVADEPLTFEIPDDPAPPDVPEAPEVPDVPGINTPLTYGIIYSNFKFQPKTYQGQNASTKYCSNPYYCMRILITLHILLLVQLYSFYP